MMFSTYKERAETCTYLGAFDSENFWRDENLAQLPAILDQQAGNIVLAMDELQFIFCRPGDTLITRYAMNKAHQDYLHSIGFSFSNNKVDVIDRCKEDNSSNSEKSLFADLTSNANKTSNLIKTSKSKSVIQLLAESGGNEYFSNFIPKNSHLSPFAVLPFTNTLSEAFQMRLEIPAIEIIKKVNSKIYSTELNQKLGFHQGGIIINSSGELLSAGTAYLEKGSIILKDEFGVSGKGNQLINDYKVLTRIVSYISNQEKKGKKVSFILEPYLQKELDFSSHFYITDTGEFHLMSVQKLLNSDFAYLGSFSVEEEFLNMLEQKGYFNILQKVSQELYQEGYHGHVCIDSMILKDGAIYPIVEINARKSMNLLKHHLDQYLNPFNVKGSFTFISTSYGGTIGFEELLISMEKEGLLFSTEKMKGIIPLTANALFINRGIDSEFNSQKVYKGRLYFAAVSKSTQSMMEVTQSMKEFMKGMKFNILN
jgi:hypothetical protein